MPEPKKWMRLDNAAKIFPAVKRRDWSNVFRLSATLTQPIDPLLLQEAVRLVAPRFPSMLVSLHRGLFWYYLEQVPEPPRVRPDSSCPLVHMTSRELETCALRVLYFRNRIAVEFFHSITDGNGGLVFLKTLTAAYVSLRDGISIPPEEGVLDWHMPPDPAEWEDSFLKVAGQVSMSRREENAFRIQGPREQDGFLHLTVATVSSEALRTLAKAHGVTITAFLAAVMLQAIMELRPRRSHRWAKVTIPVDLRRLFESRTLRNFALTVNVGVDPRLGAYSLDELCSVVQGQLAMQVTPPANGRPGSRQRKPGAGPDDEGGAAALEKSGHAPGLPDCRRMQRNPEHLQPGSHPPAPGAGAPCGLPGLHHWPPTHLF